MFKHLIRSHSTTAKQLQQVSKCTPSEFREILGSRRRGYISWDDRAKKFRYIVLLLSFLYTHRLFLYNVCTYMTQK